MPTLTGEGKNTHTHVSNLEGFLQVKDAKDKTETVKLDNVQNVDSIPYLTDNGWLEG